MSSKKLHLEEQEEYREQQYHRNLKRVAYAIYLLYSIFIIIYLSIITKTRTLDQFFPKAYSPKFGIFCIFILFGVVICFLYSLFFQIKCCGRFSKCLKVVIILGFLIVVTFYLVLGFMSRQKDIEVEILNSINKYTLQNPTANETLWFYEKTNSSETEIENYIKLRSTKLSFEILVIFSIFCFFVLIFIIYGLICGPNSPYGPNYNAFRYIYINILLSITFI